MNNFIYEKKRHVQKRMKRKIKEIGLILKGPFIPNG